MKLNASRIMAALAAALTLSTATAFGMTDDYLVIDLSKGVNATSYPVRYSSAPPNLKNDTCRTTELWLRRIPRGMFWMGDEFYSRRVTLTQDFYIGIFEVTQKQWQLVMGSNPSYYKGDTRPVEMVSYDMIRGSNLGSQWPANNNVDATSFMGRIRAKTGGVTFDLPTEAQWEYACRAGTSTDFNSGKNLTSLKDRPCKNMDQVGRYWCNSGTLDWYGNRQPWDSKGGYRDHTMVGMYKANDWDLYDMHGNVYEWCLNYYEFPLGTSAVTDPKGPDMGWIGDEWNGRYIDSRIFRGGCFWDNANRCSSGQGGWGMDPDGYQGYVGFRVCVLPPFPFFSTSLYVWPVEDPRITHPYATRDEAGLTSANYQSGVDTHAGLDIGGDKNVRAVADGRVFQINNGKAGDKTELTKEGKNFIIGRSVIISHDDGNYSLYGHLKSVASTLTRGDRIRQGDFIGEMGASGQDSNTKTLVDNLPGMGVHLHFEIKRKGLVGADGRTDYNGYVPGHPDNWGYIDPLFLFEERDNERTCQIVVKAKATADRTVIVRSTPGISFSKDGYASNYSSVPIIATIEEGKSYVATRKTENGGTWYFIDLVCRNTGAHSGMNGGWVRASDVTEEPKNDLFRIGTPEDVYTGAGSGAILGTVDFNQQFISLDNVIVGNTIWNKIAVNGSVGSDYPNKAKPYTTGWVKTGKVSNPYIYSESTIAGTDMTVGVCVSAPEAPPQLEPLKMFMVTPLTSASGSWRLEERFPPGVTPSDYGEGVWDPSARTLTWGPFSDEIPLFHTFTFTISDASKASDIVGVIIWGNLAVPVPTVTPYLSDTDDDAEGSALITTAYDGFVYDDNNAVRGTMTLNAKAVVKQDKKMGIAITNWTFSAKAVLQNASISFSGKFEGVAERFQVVTKSWEFLDIRIEGDRFYGTLAGGKVGADFFVDGARNVFADKKNLAAQERLNGLRGLYNVAMGSEQKSGVSPQGYVSLSVGNAGVVKLAGKLSDGTAVSGSAKLLEGLNWKGWYAIALHKPLYSKKGFIGGLLWLDPVEKLIRVDTDYYWFVEWKTEIWKSTMYVLGGWFGDGKIAPLVPEGLLFGVEPINRLPPPVLNLTDGRWIDEAFPSGLFVVVNGQKLSLPKGVAPKKEKGTTEYDYHVSMNPSTATLSYAAKTGIFKGSFKMYYDGLDAKGALQHKVVNVSYSGAMVPKDGELRGLGTGTTTINKEKCGMAVFLEK